MDVGANATAATSTLVIAAPTSADAGLYDCIVTGNCASVISHAGRLTVCTSDFNCDGGVDFFDYLDFVDAFSSSAASADFNNDGAIDFFDYLDFVDAFSVGCG
jgi:hypothetical protein